MSFSHQIKEEIVRYDLSDKEFNISEMLSIINAVGIITTNDNKTDICINTESILLAKRFYEIIKSVFNIKINIDIVRGKKKKVYKILIDNSIIVKDVVFKLISLDDLNLDIRSYIRGSFLSVGSISNPEKDYHVEFVFNNNINASRIKEMLEEYEVYSKIIQRKNSYVVYIKESENISTLLNIINAHSMLLKFESIRVKKNVRNKVNRVVNCETANLNKIINASLKQVCDIELIKKFKGLDKLSNKLKEVAYIRLNNPDMSLNEIAIELGISKSGVNHRFRKISEIADEIR